MSDITAPRHTSQNDELDADSLTVKLLIVLSESGAPIAYQIAALESAIATLRAGDELERELAARGQYELTDNAVFNVAE